MPPKPNQGPISDAEFCAVRDQIARDINKVLDDHILRMAKGDGAKSRAYLLACSSGLAQSFAQYVRMLDHAKDHHHGRAARTPEGGVPDDYDSDLANKIYAAMIEALFTPSEYSEKMP